MMIPLNACKYSKNQQATILLNTDEKGIIISIQNTGTDIPANEIENIFEPFYRLEKNRTACGFGLGLSLAKKIINLHRGEITVYSKPGEETTFTIHLPSARHLKQV